MLGSRRGLLTLAAALLAGALASSDARAQCSGGWCSLEVGTPDMGLSAAGAGARAQDAATAFFNPAGMTRLDRFEIQGGGFAEKLSLEFERTGGTSFSPRGDGSDAGDWTPGMGAHLVIPLSDAPLGEDVGWARDLRLGLAVSSEFDRELDYGTWVGGPFFLESRLDTLSLLPSLALRVTDWLSVGVGVQVQWAEFDRYRYDLNFGAFFGPGTFPIRADGLEDWATNAVVSLLFEPREGTRIGFRYASKSNLNLDGGDRDPPLPFFLFGQTRYERTAPQNVSVSLFHQLTPSLALLADFGWTDWSVVDRDALKLPPFISSLDRGWNDTWRLGGGVQWRLRERWRLSGGVSYDSSPARNKERTPDAPVSEQWRFSGGLEVDLLDNLSLGASGSFVYFDEPRIRGLQVGPAGFFADPPTIDGKYDDSWAYTLGATITLRFCSPLPWASCPDPAS